MASQPQAIQPDPRAIFEALNAYQRSAALKAAIELEVFTAIAEGSVTVKDLAAWCRTSERGMRILCDYLTIMGLLTKTGAAYALTADSATFLDRRSRSYMGTIARFLNASEIMECFRDLASVVRKGGPVISEQGSIERENPIWVEFARSMAPLMARPAEMIAQLVGAASGGKWKVLDIAAGHGLFGIAIARHNRNAEIVALDWPAVLGVAKENARAAGVSDRYRPLPGSAFEADFGRDYDLVLLTNFLHHFDVTMCENLLRKVHSGLKAGGRAVTFEFVPNEDRVSPPLTAAFSMIMLGMTPSGDAYTFSEYERMFANAGFTRSELHPVPPTPESVIISYR